MASFAQHVNVAVIATGVCTVPLYTASLVDLNQALVLLFFGIIGGVLPDIDLGNSKPVKIASSILTTFLPLLAVLTILQTPSLIKILLLWGISSTLLNLFIFKVLFRLTIHRGVIHSVPMGIVFAQLLSIVFFYLLGYSELFSILCGFFLFLGFMVHLLLDEFISLNVFGAKFKRSLGTALKLYTKRNLVGSTILYIAIVLLFIAFPLNMEHFIDIFKSYEKVQLL